MPSANPYDRSADPLRNDESGGNRSDQADTSASLGDTMTHRTLSDDSGTFESPFASDERAPDRRDLSVLGPTVHFRGQLSADEDLMIQGQVEGSIHHTASRLTVGAKGKVRADVHANHIVVQGEVVGDLFANEAVIIEASARVRGNVFAPRVALHEGALFKGSIDMDGVPEAASAQNPATASAQKTEAAPAQKPETPSKPAASQTRSTGRKKSGSSKDTSGSSKDIVPDSEVDQLLD